MLDRFGIEYDVLVAYHDTQAQKPSPEPFNLAVQQLGVRPDECLCVGDDPGDYLEAALEASLARQVPNGCLRPGGPKHYRLTFSTAFRVVYLNLWPFKSMAKARRRRAMRRT